MEHGYNYRLTFKASSTASRSINIGFMDNNFVHWYGGSLEALNAGAERTVAVEFYMDKATNNDACMFISMGKIDNMNTPASVITLSDFMLEKLPGRPVSPGSYVIEILDTGSMDWHVQMQKKGIVLNNGRTYRMTFEAKSSVGRKIGCALQKDGTNDSDWTSYSGGSGQYELNNKWQTFSQEFTMTSATDKNTIFNISLGAVDRIIKDAHTVYIRNIKLEDITDKPIESVPVAISDVGTEDHHVQIKKTGLTIEEGCSYEFTCNATFDGGERTIKVGIMDPTDNKYTWYGGEDFTINSTSKECKFTFKVEKPTVKTGILAISIGKIEGKDTPTGTVTLSNLSLVKNSDAMSVASLDEESSTFSSDAGIGASSLDPEAVEEETDEDVTGEEPKIVEEIQENTDEEPDTDEEIQENTDEEPAPDEEPNPDEETPEDTSNDSVTLEIADTPL